MRLGQLARHNDISVQELIEYLEEEDAAGENPLTPNTRLTDYQLDLIYDHFVVEKNEPENEFGEESDQKDKNAEIAIDNTPDHNIDLIEESGLSTELDESSENEETDPSATPPELIKEEDEEDVPKEAEIRTDEFLELLEKGDDSVDINSFTKIKAPKKKLEGIKVVGKIDLPEPPRPKAKKFDNTTTDDDASRNHKKRSKTNIRPILSEEEKEKRRQRAKNKREAAKKREEEKRQQAEKERLKELRRLHYEKNLQKKAEARERKNSQKSAEETNKQKDDRPKPKTLVGRFWRWFTSY